jgi:hypothetical protein
MSTMTQPAMQFPESRRRSFPVTAGFALLFWAAAAGSVIAVHGALDSISVPGSIAVKVGAIVLAGWLYVRLTAPRCTIDHALFVGITWLLLDIGAEIAATQHFGRGWFDLMGTPSKPALRDLLLLTWVIAPALFARFPSVDNHKKESEYKQHERPW